MLAAVLAVALSISAGVIRVPQDAPTIQAAVAAAAPGDTILVDRGTYPGGVVVPAGKRNLTIRGVDRNAVVFDGAGQRADAIVVHDYVSGAADVAYYVGECDPCNSTIRQVVARLSAVGYSGTNASGGLVIRDSVWDRNGGGILPNTLADEADPPQHDVLIVGNRVSRSGRVRVPLNTPLAGYYGIGVGIAGGNGNRVLRNTVAGSRRYGIAVFSTPYRVQTPRPPWRPQANAVRGNAVRGSGLADLALSASARSGNCFRASRAQATMPARLQKRTCR